MTPTETKRTFQEWPDETLAKLAADVISLSALSGSVSACAEINRRYELNSAEIAAYVEFMRRAPVDRH